MRLINARTVEYVKPTQNSRRTCDMWASCQQYWHRLNQVPVEVTWCIWVYSYRRLGEIVRPYSSRSNTECSHYVLSKSLEIFSQLPKRLQFL